MTHLEREAFRQFNGRMIEELCALGSRMVEIAMADIQVHKDVVCLDPHCRWYSATMEHYVSDHAQMDEIFREEQRHLGR